MTTILIFLASLLSAAFSAWLLRPAPIHSTGGVGVQTSFAALTALAVSVAGVAATDMPIVAALALVALSVGLCVGTGISLTLLRFWQCGRCQSEPTTATPTTPLPKARKPVSPRPPKNLSLAKSRTGVTFGRWKTGKVSFGQNEKHRDLRGKL